MKRVALISHGLSDGGAERVASILANQLAERGYAVLFLAVYSDQVEYKLNEGIVYQYVGSQKQNKILKLVERAGRIKKAIESFRADIAISFIINETIMLSLLTKVPMIYSLRIDPAVVMAKKLDRVLCPFLYERSKRVVFQTSDARAYFNDCIQKKGVVIGNPLSPNLPFWRGPDVEKRIVTAGRLSAQKNHKMLIEAFAKFVKEYPEYRLEIYGAGPLKTELEQYIKQQSVEQKAFLMGHSSHVHEIMANSAIFVLSSDFEGLSNSMLEALAIGIPSVCTDCPPGGAAEYIKDGENGMLVPVGDVNALYEKLCSIASSPSLAEHMSNKSREVRAVLSESAVIGKWERIINDNGSDQ